MKGAGGRWWIVPMVLVLASAPAIGSAQAALSQAVGLPTTPRSLGMADAQAGGGVATTAMFSNPAGIALGRVFHTEGWWAFANDLGRHVAGVAATDSTTPVAGGIGFTYTYTGLEAEQSNYYDVRTGIAMQFADLIAVGVNLKYVRVDYAEGLTLPHGSLNDFSLDAGAMFTYDRFFVGVTGTNLTNLDHPMAPLMLVTGAGLSVGPARFEFDASFDWSSYDEQQDLGMKYAVGGEVLIADAFVLRAGYSYEDVPDVHGIAAGIGYVNTDLALDFGFQQDLSGVRSDSRLGLSVRYFVQ
ncbi:MAG: hypothetical protein JXB32_01375 [Deltaproteobacteria bacterium]|nr:hypothetical protein [Deltaproteobacteria bacterium]